ncbi:hypothetical protein B9Z55_024759 [Caenorhabditis nigoni]|nr:hypothetical protein B9Z55_024759 [Caenorhabditis nigoni]
MLFELLKTVIEYMEPNKRFELARRCPLLRQAEKATPLRIKTLKFGLNKVDVDNTRYQIGLHREANEGRSDLEWDDDYRDVDKDGFPVRMPGMAVLPGDLSLNSSNQKLKKYIRQDAYERNNEKKKDLEWDLGSRSLELQMQDISQEECNKKTNIIKTSLIAFECLKNNTPLPYETFAKFTIRNSTGQTVHRFEYDKPLFHMVKYLTTCFFEGRKHPIIVNNLSTDALLHQPIRLPPGVRFHVNNWNATSHFASVYAALKPVLTESSVPFKKLELALLPYMSDELNHPVIQSAQRLIIKPVKMEDPSNIMWYLLKFPNPVIGIYANKAQLRMNHIDQWVDHRKRNGWGIGKRLEVYYVEDWIRDIVYDDIYGRSEKDGNRRAFINIPGGRIVFKIGQTIGKRRLFCILADCVQE